MKIIIVAAALAITCACGRKQQEQPPVPGDTGSPAAAPAAPAASGNPLAAPANYVKRTTDQIGGAKAAAALYEDTAAKRMDPGLGGE